ncbi:MAG TPA: DUF6282 family protein [Roseiflexaceae bacterium]|nr:DUF6282 family protein [Roseiflexaceae bacterium]
MTMLPDGRSYDLSRELLIGAIDIHVHAGPHIFSSPRRVDPVEAAIIARDAGMQAIVYMDVFEMSNGTAGIVNRVVRDFTTSGGLIMNTVYGGMNPRAVKTALAYGEGAKFVSFGAHSTYFQAAREGRVVDGVFRPLSEIYLKSEELDRCIRIPLDEPPGAELDEILHLIASYPETYLNTGHVSVAEAMRVVDLAQQYGIKNVLVASSVTKIATLDELRAMAAKGAFIEYTLAAYTHTTSIPKTHYYVEKEYAAMDEGMGAHPKGGIKLVADQIMELGPQYCIIASDFGVYTLPDPVEGLREFIACLLDLGVPADEVRTMVKRNPERLLGRNG